MRPGDVCASVVNFKSIEFPAGTECFAIIANDEVIFVIKCGEESQWRGFQGDLANLHKHAPSGVILNEYISGFFDITHHLVLPETKKRFLLLLKISHTQDTQKKKVLPGTGGMFLDTRNKYGINVKLKLNE